MRNLTNMQVKALAKEIVEQALVEVTYENELILKSKAYKDAEKELEKKYALDKFKDNLDKIGVEEEAKSRIIKEFKYYHKTDGETFNEAYRNFQTDFLYNHVNLRRDSTLEKIQNQIIIAQISSSSVENLIENLTKNLINECRGKRSGITTP